MTISDPKPGQELAYQERRLSALRATFLVASHHGLSLRPEDLPQLVEGDMAPLVATALAGAGLRTRLLEGCNWATAAEPGTACPALLPMQDGRRVILVLVVVKEAGPMAAILDPTAEGLGIRLIPMAQVLQHWTGRILLVPPQVSEVMQTGPFGLSWFLPALAAQRSLLAGVVVAAGLAGNLIAFSLPLMFQAIVDRVIAHQAWNMLATVVAIFVVLALFDTGFSYMRQRLMMLAGGKVDALVGGRTFAHLLSLPLVAFEAVPAGVMARHIQQTEKIRAFLTGGLFQTGLDAAFLPLLLVVLAFLSPWLTLVVFGFALATAGCIGLLLPYFRTRLNALYFAEGERQAHLVEIRGQRSRLARGQRRDLRSGQPGGGAGGQGGHILRLDRAYPGRGQAGKLR